ncbi:MAG: 50S ribosomal protein L2 [Methanophagales archaeon]|nr:50S ribosomal protein L2 [Methanophagales archaeon]MCW3137507.1 50S ribosomal protein L2 [Methanophagales archaeon]MCW3139551.1 50S ribosomal protein L2 [Methanophagales archaeon]MCW7069571.1 50S ribosomal protein L2 [Methanophagales archaeon]MCW7072341.1 50S ribosomal protein L2 [Methanophagales archaeon]
MGKRIIAQRRGKGSPVFTAPSHRYKGNLEHVRVDGNEPVTGRVVQILHDPARSAPIARLRTNRGEERFMIVPEGIGEGEEVTYGESAAIKVGNTLPLRCIPEGIAVCNIEGNPGDGGKFARASGNYATLVTHEVETGRTLVVMPSGKKKWLSGDCMATIGVVAGGGRTEKPFVKAGKKYHKMKPRAARYPRVRGVAMNPVDHPFGGGGHQHIGKSKTPGRGAPPGRKVGNIAARRTGYRR